MISNLKVNAMSSSLSKLIELLWFDTKKNFSNHNLMREAEYGIRAFMQKV